MIEGRTLEGIRFGIIAGWVWAPEPVPEERIKDMARFLTENPESTYDDYVDHVIKDIVVNADD